MNLDIGIARKSADTEEDDEGACHLLIDLARREMCAYVMATTEIYGSEIVSAAEDSWLGALNKIDFKMPPNQKVWRDVTVQAASQLAAQIASRRAEVRIYQV